MRGAHPDPAPPAAPPPGGDPELGPSLPGPRRRPSPSPLPSPPPPTHTLEALTSCPARPWDANGAVGGPRGGWVGGVGALPCPQDPRHPGGLLRRWVPLRAVVSASPPPAELPPPLPSKASDRKEIARLAANERPGNFPLSHSTPVLAGWPARQGTRGLFRIRVADLREGGVSCIPDLLEDPEEGIHQSLGEIWGGKSWSRWYLTLKEK